MNHELGEAWLAKRLLDQTGVDVFAGTADSQIRCDRIRSTILEHGLATILLGKGAEGKPENYSQIFERLYGAPLTEPNSKQG